MQETDLIIIGGGPGGYETAAEAASSGLKVVLFERDRLGGTCLNRGCIPTKCLCATAKRLNDIRKAADLGVSAADPVLDFDAVRKRLGEVTDTLRDGIETVLDGVEIVREEASLSGPDSVTAGGKTYTAPRIIIATGSAPARLNADSAGSALTSDDVLALDHVPESMLIIGGGVIGLEFASVFNSFGSRVTVLEYCKEILPGFDRDIAKRLRSYLSRRGIEFATGAEVTAVEGSCVRYVQKGKEKNAEAACVVTAVGRKAVVPDGLEKAGIETDRRGFIKPMRTFAPRFLEYMLSATLTDAACSRMRPPLKAVPFWEQKSASILCRGWCSPILECAMAGLTSEQADETDREYMTVRLPYGSNGKALASARAMDS